MISPSSAHHQLDPSGSPEPDNDATAAAVNAGDDEHDATAADLPMTLAASVVLDNLPRDAHAALQRAGDLRDQRGGTKEKVKIRLSPLPGAKSLRAPVFWCGTAQRFEFVVKFVRRKLVLKQEEGVFCYVNSVFAPGLDEGVGNLWRCFKTGEELVVNYSVAQAFG